MTGVNIDITERKRAEERLRDMERLRASERRLTDILSFLPDATFTLDKEGRIIAWNKAMENLTGALAADVLGKGDNEYAYRIYGKRIPGLAGMVLRGDEARWPYSDLIREMEFTKADTYIPHLKPGGVWLSIRVAPIYDTQGDIIGVIDSCRDITERKQMEEILRESEKRYRALTAASSQVLYRMSRDWSEMRQLHGGGFLADLEQPNRSWLQEYVPPDEQALVQEAIGKAVSEGSVFDLEHRVCRMDGTIGWTLSRTIPVRNDADEITEWFSAATDVTERKRAEEALHVANERLLEADRRKDEFLAMLAHELRNPLAPVRNAMQVLRLTGSQDPRAMRQQDIIDRQVTHMARLLDDLLDVSRVTRGKIELQMQPLDLVGVLAHAVETTTPLIEARQHTFEFSLPSDDLRVNGDLDRLTQVFGNLLANAAKYTDEGGQIWLEARREEGGVVVRVRDAGVGIAPEMLPRVFDLFAQADHSLGRSRGGLGIGLTMVRNLVAQHGGSVEAHSKGLGQGSEFLVRLPALPKQGPAPERRERIPVTPYAPVARRVLVVDDVADSASSLAELLQLWGHETRTVNDGLNALNEARNFQPDVVLLDIGMPGMDGCETARRLRAEHGSGLTLVALTGYGQTHDREATHAAGFNHHLVKPVDLQQIQNLLTRSMNPS